MTKARVLLAEDDKQLGFVIKDNLQESGYDVVLCENGQVAIDTYKKNEFDICLLDIMMPEKDGFMVAKKIRQQSDQVPILFLTAKTMEEDKVRAFLTGGDDYITKPFSMKELQLRMDVFLRRTKKMHSETSIAYRIGTLEFSFSELIIKTMEGVQSLTQREADLLRFLCNHPNRVIKREEVLMEVWGKDDYFLGRSMDVFIAKLRKHFKSDPGISLETIHGVGFRFSTVVEPIGKE